MKKRYPLKLTLTLVLAVSALTCLLLAFTACGVLDVFDERSDAERELAALLNLLEERYIGQYDDEEVIAAAMRAAIDALGDEWSYYMTREEYERHLDHTNNRFTGIGVGVVIDEEAGGIRVMHTFKGSAAEKAGVVAGDVITEIDGGGIAGISLSEIRTLLARPIGDTVRLTVLRGDGTVVYIDVVYSVIFTDPVEFEMLDGNIGYIAIANFDRGAAESFIAAVEELLEQGAVSFVYDVRGNNGGRLYEMTAMLDFLLPEGEIFISVDKSGNEDIIYSDASMIDVPAVVIVNRFSFSAAEYFAATLREYNYAEIVGENTTGKNRVQTTYRMPSGGALHLSSSQYLTKNRVSLHDTGGITPDHPVALSDEDFSLLVSGRLEKAGDAQLQAALFVLMG
jgi:carboxyl-terminal processing protease